MTDAITADSDPGNNESAIAHPPTGALEHVDPTTLVLEDNVRDVGEAALARSPYSVAGFSVVMADGRRMRHNYELRLGADQLAAPAPVIEFGSFDAG
jgi:hypothetical protein